MNHPNICTLHDMGPKYLVMEFVSSPNGPVPLGEALRIARQITDAFEAAPRKGYRPSRPQAGNIKVKPDGTVKLLEGCKKGAASLHPTAGAASAAAGAIW